MDIYGLSNAPNEKYFVIEASHQYVLEKFDMDPTAERIRAHVPKKTAFALGLLQDGPQATEIRLDGVVAPVLRFPDATLCLIDLMLDPAARPHCESDRALCYVPRAAFDRVGGVPSNGRVFDPALREEIGQHDGVLASLRACIADVADRGIGPGDLILDQLVTAAHIHVKLNYTRQKSASETHATGLAPWQLRRAREFFDTHIASEIALNQVAETCGLSVSHFARAFRQSTGRPPHRWLIERRVEKVKRLLQSSNLSLVEIAAACGFADQSHLSRVFSRTEGEPPGTWRRLRVDGMARAAQAA